MARLTRKELKTDKFALELEQTFSFFEEHQQAILRYGAVVVVLVLLLGGIIMYRRHQQTLRENALSRAIDVQETGVGPPAPGATTISTFPTQQVKDEAVMKAFTDVRNKYPGSDEAEIAGYYLGTTQAGEGKLADAEKTLQEVADKGNERYSSLAKFALGQVYFADNKVDQGTKAFQDLAAHPTVFVSKEQAQIALARALAPIKPDEARKILDPLRNTTGPVAQVAVQMYTQLSPK